MSTTITTSQSAMSSPLKRLIIRHPLLAFFIIAFAGTWIAFLPLLLAQNGLGLFPYTISAIGPYPPSYYFAALGALLGPTLASFTVTAITAGKAGAVVLYDISAKRPDHCCCCANLGRRGLVRLCSAQSAKALRGSAHSADPWFALGIVAPTRLLCSGTDF